MGNRKSDDAFQTQCRPVRPSYRIDTASRTEVRSFIDRCTNALRQSSVKKPNNINDCRLRGRRLWEVHIVVRNPDDVAAATLGEVLSR
jgi:hypothetical protein